MTQQRISDAERLGLIRERLYTAVLADVLDQLGHRQSCMSARVRPLLPGSMIVGRARTALATEVYALPDKPYEGEIEMLDGLQPDQVLVCGDDDGVVVVPRELEEQAVALALEKVAGEKRALTHLQAGGYLREVWERYGVL